MLKQTLRLLDNLSSVRTAPDLCAALHAVVRRFRIAQRIAEQDVEHEIGCARYHRIINGYLARIGTLEHAEVINRITPQAYADLRQAGRLKPLYPELPPAALQILADEIRAALAWQELSERSSSSTQLAVSDDDFRAEDRREGEFDYAVGA